MNADPDEEVVRKAWAAYSRRDMEAYLELVDPEVELVPFGAAMEGKAYRGHEGVLQWHEEEIAPNWDVFDVTPEEFVRVGDKLLVFGRWTARGHTSGVELDVAATWIIEVRKGRIVSWSTHTDREEAMRQVGFGRQNIEPPSADT